MSGGGEEYRAWPAGPGLFEVDGQDPGRRRVTNVRRLAGTDRAPGSAVIGTAAGLLLLLGGGVLAVSFAGQFAYLDAARHQAWAANIEALMFDLGMIIFTMLALGLSMAGKPSRAERVLIMACAAGSAAMGWAAADVTSPRSVAAFVAPPLFLAVVIDRVVAVVRRHVLAGAEASPWAGLGRVLLAAGRAAGLVALYSLRLVLSPRATPAGLRRFVLAAAPLPAAPAKTPRKAAGDAAPLPAVAGVERNGGTPPHGGGPGTKKDRFLAAYRAHEDYGDRKAAGRVAAELAPGAGLQAGTGRTYIAAELARLNGSAR